MRLVLVRHGETEHNRGQLTLGRADLPLNERGRMQAEALASSFSAAPDAIYASPLRRAYETATRIGAATDVAVQREHALIEMDVGEMEHLTGAELRERYPDFLAQWLSPDCADARMPGGETLAEVQARVWGAIERIRGRHPDGVVVAVTHNFVILTLLCRALGLPLSHFRRLKQMLAAKTVLDITDHSSQLLQLNDTAHLMAAGLADDLLAREARP
ncbi:MAG TPA: histidine phosphatase family protein [Dehalococcoidia bacterium]|nr:histidine phosphatase family protein [Dehalococcoidia bacterium]